MSLSDPLTDSARWFDAAQDDGEAAWVLAEQGLYAAACSRPNKPSRRR